VATDIDRELKKLGEYTSYELSRGQIRLPTISKSQANYTFYIRGEGGEDYLAGLEDSMKNARKYLGMKGKMGKDIRKNLSVAFSVQIIQNFQSQTDSTGADWAPLEDATVKRRKRRSPFARTSKAKAIASRVSKRRKSGETDRKYKARQRERSRYLKSRIEFLESKDAEKRLELEGTAKAKAARDRRSPLKPDTRVKPADLMQYSTGSRGQSNMPLIDSGELFNQVTGTVGFPNTQTGLRMASNIEGTGAFDLTISANGEKIAFVPKSGMLSKETKKKIEVHNRTVATKGGKGGKVPGREFIYTTPTFAELVKKVLGYAGLAAAPDGTLSKQLKGAEQTTRGFAKQLSVRILENRGINQKSIYRSQLSDASLFGQLLTGGFLSDKDINDFNEMVGFLDGGRNLKKLAVSAERYLKKGRVR